jgi:hypothetical protein
MDQFLANRNTDGTFKQVGFARLVKPIFSLRCRPGRCGSPCQRVLAVLAADDPPVLDRASHSDNTRVDLGDPAIAVFFIGYRCLGSRPPRSGLERSDFVHRRLAAVGEHGLGRLNWAESGSWLNSRNVRDIRHTRTHAAGAESARSTSML